MNKIRISFLAVSLVLLMVFLPMLIPVAEARGRVCDFCDGMYLKTLDGGTKTITSHETYMNGAHYIQYLYEQTFYVVCTKNSKGHKTTHTYWGDWQLMGY